jgi:hypothetical protein
MNRVQFVENKKVLKTKISNFLPRAEDYIELSGKTYIATKVTINILNDMATVELIEVSQDKVE